MQGAFGYISKAPALSPPLPAHSGAAGKVTHRVAHSFTPGGREEGGQLCSVRLESVTPGLCAFGQNAFRHPFLHL